MTAGKTESEEVFERYLNGSAVSWQRIDVAGTQTPDYIVTHGNARCIFEVKEFNEPGIRPVGGFSPCKPIREKLMSAAKQFKAYRDDCCAVVLWNSKSIYRSTQPEIVCSAAFGERLLRDPDIQGDEDRVAPPCWKFLGTAALTKTHNTRISAIVVLTAYRLDHLWVAAWRQLNVKRQKGEPVDVQDQFEALNELSSKVPRRFSFEGTVRCVVIENPYARVAFPDDLLMGPFDQRGRMKNGWFSVVNLGSALKGLLRSGVPFTCL